MDKNKEEKDPELEEEEKLKELEEAKKDETPPVVIDTRLLKNGDYELHVRKFPDFLIFLFYISLYFLDNS